MNSYENVKLAAISGVFNGTDEMHQNILEICNQTPNADVAIDMLLGTYKEPVFPVNSMSTSSDKKIRTFVSYDKFRNEITYTEPKEDTTRYGGSTASPETWLKGAAEYEKLLGDAIDQKIEETI